MKKEIFRPHGSVANLPRYTGLVSTLLRFNPGPLEVRIANHD
jgi:hypothetical protein